MFTAGLYILAAICLLLSSGKDKAKTRAALKKGWLAFEKILPQFLVIIISMGISLAVLSPELIAKLVGQGSGWPGMLGASIVGSLSIIPGFIAFPLAATLLANGAGLMQITVFVSTLMAVGVATLPLEIKIFGPKIALMRNGLAYLSAFVVALAVGLVYAWL